MRLCKGLALVSLLGICVLGAPSLMVQPGEAQGARPELNLEFATTMHIAEGYGHDGDGCILAEKALETNPVVSQ